jgi:CDP-diacylglycerol--glycerol-3-phosphate 3-phosphatidyltransferase
LPPPVPTAAHAPNYSEGIAVEVAAVLNQTNIRSGLSKVLDPVANGLLKIGLTPDLVTLIGTVGVSLAALIFFPRGEFVIGVLVIVAFVFSDMIDGAMARMQKRSGPWGAFLDSSLDRVADGFIFGSLVIWAARTQSETTVLAALLCLVGGFLISYAKSRAEGLGMECNVGVAERIYGLGVAYVLPAALWILTALIALTVAQRFAVVYRQSARLAAEADPHDLTDDPREETP